MSSFVIGTFGFSIECCVRIICDDGVDSFVTDCDPVGIHVNHMQHVNVCGV